LKLIESESVFLLNPDTVVTGGSIRAIVEFLESNPQPKIVGPTVLNVDGSPQDTVHQTLPAAFEFVVQQTGLSHFARAFRDSSPQFASYKEPKTVGWVSGAAIAFNRKVIDLIGALDEDMFWAEDMDFCFRARRAGIPVYHLPGACIIHYSGESGKKNYRRMIFAQHSSRVGFAKKHYGRPAEVGVRTVFGLLLPIKIAVRLMQLPIRGRRTESEQRLAGYWDALRVVLAGKRPPPINDQLN
jgi:GT2 family glycosyltransferase